MNAYKCDICGRYYKESIKETGINPVTGSEMGWNINKIQFHQVTGSKTKSTPTYDICPECIDRFTKTISDIHEESKAAGIEVPY